MLKTWRQAFLFAASVSIAACGGDSLTSPTATSNPTDSGGGVVVSTQPTPTPSASPAPVGSAPYAEFDKVLKDGSGQICNPTNHPVETKIEYFDATVFTSQTLLKTIPFTVEAGKCVAVRPAAELLDLACGLKLTLQLDASTKSAHIGHVFVDITTPACGCEDYTRPGPTKFAGSLVFTPSPATVEVNVEGASPEGSTFFPTLPAVVARPAFGSPATTFSTTQTYTGTYGPRELECRYTDSRTLEVSIPAQECVEKATKTSSVSYGEWSEIKKDGNACYQERTVTTTVVTDYVCKEDEISVETSTERRSVECPCDDKCKDTKASYKSGANGGLFNLDNSGDATELEWVDTYVSVGPWKKIGYEGSKNDDCTYADMDAKVAIVKAGSSHSIAYEYRTYLNVKKYDLLCSYDPPGSSRAKDISHVTYFDCK